MSTPRRTTAVVALAFLLSCAALALVTVQGPAGGRFIRIDRLAAVMLVLVTGISSVVHAFSIRYLDGDPRIGRFFTRLFIVTACVALLVCANDVLLLAAAWTGVSFALYDLQTHFRERESALAAAVPMRVTHLAGDAAMVFGCILLAFAAGTTRLDAILASGPALPPFTLPAVCSLLTIAAFSKSAQIPFHRWLPETLEAPTPVSALMHAGVVNAGGFAFARFSPFFAELPALMTIVFLAGAATALWGTACMLVRPDVKRGLAYSTMGQMGYMTMQCGLGGFAAAILHLAAHGIFKATLFLGSGYAIHDHKAELRAPAAARSDAPRPPAAPIAALVLGPLAFFAVWRSPLGTALPPYGWVLLAFAALTVMQAVYAIVRRGTALEFAAAIGAAATVMPGYAWLVGAFDRFLAAGVETQASLVAPPLAGAVVGLFAATLPLGWGLVRVAPALRDRVYVWLLSERLPLPGVRA
jgi:NADH:ubiquinone oxidoreductase subunit 5 (subunit L)/multisubunit Na+/H+ antiporter MnhA subunit